LAAVKLNDKWGYINTSGQFIIEPQFGDAKDFADNGLASVKNLNAHYGQYGYINASGQFFIQPQFDYAGNFGESGLAMVVLNNKYGYINTMKFIVEPQFQDAKDFSDNDLAAVKLNDKWGIYQHIRSIRC
jgi:hypothetical protein